MDYPKLETLHTLALQAGEAIMQVYEKPIEVTEKADQSPVTKADLAAHKVIQAGLSSLTPDIPILSEEGKQPDFHERQGWQHYWLVDPLDGTKEFIKRNDEFTVNIALIVNGRATRSVVYAPALGVSYWGDVKGIAKKCLRNGEVQDIHCRPLPEQGWKVLLSRSHLTPEIEAFVHKLKQPEGIPAGSSLKFCLIAEGLADIYPRLGPTSEWDTAAGQCILEAAGGGVIQTNGKPLRYNQKDDLQNPDFLAVSTSKYDWAQFFTE